MNETWTTSSGFTQCARSLGRPFPFVKGGAGISRRSSVSRIPSSGFAVEDDVAHGKRGDRLCD